MLFSDVIVGRLDEGYGPMVWLGAVVGMRWGEVAGLRVGRLDFLRSIVTVSEQRTRGQRGRMVAELPKSAAGRRSFAVPAPLMAMLSDHLASRGLTGADVDAFVFVAPGGGPLHYSNWLRRVWYPACVAAGLGQLVEVEGSDRARYVGLGFHDLRRANATALVAEGVDLKTAQARLGHSNPRLTLGAPGFSASTTRPTTTSAGWTRDERLACRGCGGSHGL